MSALRPISVILVCAGLLVSGRGFPEEPVEEPVQIDLAAMKPRVVKAEVVDSISMQIMTQFKSEVRSVSAKEGQKLVVVWLETEWVGGTRLLLWTDDFSVIYEDKDRKIGVSRSVAIGFGSWIIPPEGTEIKVETSLWLFGVQFAAVVPEAVTSFDVRYPALAAGKATLGGEAAGSGASFYPLTTPSGRILATRREIPAPWQASTTSLTSL